MREDSTRVDRLARALQAAGIRVWRDINDIDPGGDWKLAIRQAINNDSVAFLACFSKSSQSREITYQREELILAAEQMRQRTPGQAWLIPVRFDDCQIPDYDIGAGRTFNNLHRVDIFDRDRAQLARLTETLKGFLRAKGGVAQESMAGGCAPPASGDRIHGVLDPRSSRDESTASPSGRRFFVQISVAVIVISAVVALLVSSGVIYLPIAGTAGSTTVSSPPVTSSLATSDARDPSEPVGMTGGCNEFRVFAQNRFNPSGSAIRLAPTPHASLLRTLAPNYQFYVDGYVHGDVAYIYNPPPLNSDIWFHVSDGGWVSLAGIRSVPTNLDPTGYGDAGPLVPTPQECLGALQ